GFAGQREDRSGLLLKELLEEKGYRMVESLLLPDEQSQIEEELIRLSDQRDVNLIVTTGGTGFSPRDCTPEATLAVATRNAPGISEAIRLYSMAITKRAMLSRGVSVIRGKTLIVNLPGSPKAVKESMDCIVDQLPHGLNVLLGRVSNCARP
ncbi:MAG: MogA/MoaB family molybdenum cofactor biosynthesis protein, partial [Clostridiales bacterium]|nr:MogA/MoaB family molybdenum cofactor biosynthesis protein [Clostridiales bacterium]